MTLRFDTFVEVVEIHVHAQFYRAKCSSSWVVIGALDFGQLLDFDGEFLWNGSSNWQAENGVIN